MKNIKEEIKELKKELGMVQNVPCSTDEAEQYKDMYALPSDVFLDPVENKLCRCEVVEMNAEEKQEYYQLAKLSYLKSIKGYLKFFVILTIISLVASAILLIAGGSAIGSLL